MTELSVPLPAQDKLHILSYWRSPSAVNLDLSESVAVASRIKENFLRGLSEKVKVSRREKGKDVDQSVSLKKGNSSPFFIILFCIWISEAA
jgi:hypothetical protein